VPAAGAKVQVASGHRVVYDQKSDAPIRMVHILGTLSFARDKDTRLTVGLIKVGGDESEDGFGHASHADGSRAVLEVGTQDNPIPEGHTSMIRLAYFEGLDKESFPAIVCNGGRMDLHGAPIGRTWLKLGAPVRAGETELTLAEAVAGWRIGDRIIVTATTRQNKIAKTFRDSVRDNTQTEERTIQSIDGSKIVLDAPLAYDHICEGEFRGDVANLSRNVVIESAEPEVARGHTMYHHGSAGSVSYTEFRHLGKRGVLGRYSLHFHQLRDSMRGSSVIGASIWDSGNRWITIHGTDYLVVRDCVGYNSIGHGFFLEDGTESFNILDRNLAVQARIGKPLPNQVLPFDHNDGAGFWWANSRNSFTRNVACECDEYGYRFDAAKTQGFDPEINVPEPNGSLQKTDIRTLSFVRFEDNESHCQRRHAFNLGGLDTFLKGGCDGIGPDIRHPFIIKNTRVWNTHWAFHTLAPSVMIDGFKIHHSEYGLWRQNFDRHSYRGLAMDDVSIKAIFDSKGSPPEEAAFPGPLMPVDDLAPIVIVTRVSSPLGRKVTVHGVATDTGDIKRIQVNGVDARPLRPNFAEWEAVITDGFARLTIRAEDAAGNVA
jgi:hypothetical protein